jgi:hypothetical protein
LAKDEEGRLELISFKSFKAHDELIYVIDFLNKSLKNKKIMFGLTKNSEKDEMTVKIYEF